MLRQSGSVTRKFGNLKGSGGNLVLVNSFDAKFSSIKFRGSVEFLSSKGH